MKRLAFILIALFSSSSFAQAPGPFPAIPLRYAKDTEVLREKFVVSNPFYVSLIKDLNSAKARVGDQVELVIHGEIKEGSGKVLLSRKTRFTGHVTKAEKRDRKHPAQLAFVVEQGNSEGSIFRVQGNICGTFSAPPEIKYIDGNVNGRYLIGSPRTGLPEDVELLPPDDTAIGTVLASRIDNIHITPQMTFFICELGPKPEEMKREILVPASLPGGTQLPTILRKPLETDKIKPGMSVEMLLAADLTGPGNTLAIPKGAAVMGKVIKCAAGSKTEPSQLAIIAENVIWPGGTVPLHAFVSRPPTLDLEAFDEKMRGRDFEYDVRGITVEELTNGVRGYKKQNGPLRLPVGTVIILQQSE